MVRRIPTKRGGRSRLVPHVPLRPYQLTLIYILFGGIWIVFSDIALAQLLEKKDVFWVFQTFKGLIYVLVSAILVHWLALTAVRSVERRVLAEQLERTQRLLETVLANLGEVVMLVDPTRQKILQCNSTVVDMFGYQPDELLGRSTEVLHTDHEAYEQFSRDCEPALDRSGVFRIQYRMRHKDGRLIVTENTLLSMVGETGWRESVVSIIRDITQRKHAEEALRESEARYRLLAENTVDVIWAMDEQLRFTYINPAIYPLAGYPAQECIGKPFSAFSDPAEYPEIRDRLTAAMSVEGGQVGLVFEITLIHVSGERIAVELHGKATLDEDGRVSGLQGIFIDIRNRLELEAQLRQSQKLEGMGRLAGGVAHEINNPLTAIGQYAELLKELAGDSAEVEHYSSEILRETHRIQTIVQNLLGFAREERTTKLEPISIQEVVDSAVPLIQTVMRHDAMELKWEISDGLPRVMCHCQQMQQVLINLLANARDAIVDARCEKQILIAARTTDKAGRTWVRLTVEDHGPGISAPVREHLFDPFFTTKPKGRGTGLGLWIVYNIVKQHGGEISVDSEPGRFTRFCIDLPIAS